jgi:enoyl-[acyl-carrier protein] reductase II
MSNIVCKRLGIEVPILQGPMAWASDSVLSAAVSNAGGIGIMGIGFSPAAIFESEIVKIKTLTKKPFGCNLITAVPNANELLDIILREKVPVVELETTPAFYGSLSSFTEKLKANGTIVIGKVCSVHEAVVLEKAGSDFVSVKGADGGGHIYGYTGTFSLIPQVVDSVSIPVINSSGVGDARGVAASFALGASAVEIGSRFLLAEECQVHSNYKKAILEAEEGDTVLTGTSINDPVRGLRNKLADEVLEIEKQFKGDEAASRIQKICSGSLRKAAVNGDTEGGSVVVGQVVGLLNKIQSVREIIDELISPSQRKSQNFMN